MRTRLRLRRRRWHPRARRSTRYRRSKRSSRTRNRRTQGWRWQRSNRCRRSWRRNRLRLDRRRPGPRLPCSRSGRSRKRRIRNQHPHSLQHPAQRNSQPPVLGSASVQLRTNSFRRSPHWLARRRRRPKPHCNKPDPVRRRSSDSCPHCTRVSHVRGSSCCKGSCPRNRARLARRTPGPRCPSSRPNPRRKRTPDTPIRRIPRPHERSNSRRPASGWAWVKVVPRKGSCRNSRLRPARRRQCPRSPSSTRNRADRHRPDTPSRCIRRFRGRHSSRCKGSWHCTRRRLRLRRWYPTRRYSKRGRFRIRRPGRSSRRNRCRHEGSSSHLPVSASVSGQARMGNSRHTRSLPHLRRSNPTPRCSRADRRRRRTPGRAARHIRLLHGECNTRRRVSASVSEPPPIPRV
jgi:hypothetical protein